MFELPGPPFLAILVLRLAAAAGAQPVVLGRGRVVTGTDLEKAATLALDAALAEAGIIVLLFLLGLELSLQRLWRLRRYVLGVGVAQGALTTLAIGVSGRALGAVPPAGIISGSMHDAEGARGVVVSSAAHPEPWTALGDGGLDDPKGTPDAATLVPALAAG